MSHDYGKREKEQKNDLAFMLGYRCDPGANTNSFSQTDKTKWDGTLEVAIDGKIIEKIYLPDDPADSRGALSHHYQPTDLLLEEAGTYGTFCDVIIPSDVLKELKNKKSFTVTFAMNDEKGLSIFSRTSGRYGLGIVIKAE